LADATQIHQVLMNLSTNAYHALRDTGGVIEISLNEVDLTPGMAAAHPRLMPGKHAVITVNDNGIGMSQETLQRIFEPYFTTKASGEGTGLGLAIVDSIIEQHGGTIDVLSELGKGTKFEIFFPICLSSDKEWMDEIEPEKPLGTERVLFVDDEQDIVDINRNGLQRLGYSVTAFSNPLEAVEYFEFNSNDFDVVVTDLTMPKMTGTDLADRIHAVRPDIPLVLCSGFAKSAREVRGKLSGILEFVEKPIKPGSVGWAIRRVMEKQRAESKQGFVNE
jgi:CheY-like chemotaxis protein